MQARGASTWPATPGAPTIGTATAGINNCASVTFTAPGCTGAFPAGITGYRVISTPGCFSNTGASSPVVVSGLSTGTSYTFKAQATNANGYGALSAASNSITATLQTCATFTTPGSFTWVAPTGVTSVAVLAVGGGGGGRSGGCTFWGGGALAYRNGVSTTPGTSYTIVVGVGGVNSVGGSSYASSLSSNTTANGGGTGTQGEACFTGQGGGKGGKKGNNGGGGAGGYSGQGGGCGNGVAGSGGAGGSGGEGVTQNGTTCRRVYWGAGGGVGLYGAGSNGAGGSGGTTGGGGGGGSGGSAGGTASVTLSPPTGGAYGGGGGTTVLQMGPYVCCSWSSTTYYYGAGSGGAYRIVWAGGARGTPSFPSTCVGA